jgi:hypothetical protein
LPKNGLDSALSAQTCSLSENWALLWRLAMTGLLHAVLRPAIAPVMSSVWETAIASSPLNGACPGTAEVRLA